MRLFIVSVIYNVLLIFVLVYIIIFTNNDIKMHYLVDIRGLNEEEGVLLLKEYEVAIVYLESEEEKAKILYTEPASNDLVYEKQLITVYVSKGYRLPVFKTIEKQNYNDVKPYLDSLIEEYKIDVKLTYKKDKILPDGLIVEQKGIDQFIDMFDTLELVIIDNPKSVKIPSFIGWHYSSVLSYVRENDLNIEVFYVEILYPKDYVIGQSVLEGEYVLKNSNPIIIYVSKES